jgi:hypothetical protein
MKFHQSMAVVAAAALLVACATKPQGPVALTASTLQGNSGHVGVILAEPQRDLYLPGASCLLCLGVAVAANGTLNSYAKTLKDDEIVQVKDELVAALRKKGLDAAAVDGVVDLNKLPDLKLGDGMSRHDFASYAKRFDRVVVVEITQAGIERPYASYIPTGDAKAVLRGSAYMVDIKSNKLEWFEPLAITKGSDAKWDEPPTFPGLTNAYYQAIEAGKEQIEKPFL